MANSASNLDLVANGQASVDITINALADAASPASLFGRRQSTTSGLVWGYYGGNMMVDGVLTQIANGSLTLVANTTRFVEATRAGVVSSNTVGFTAGAIPLYTVVVGATTITSYTDNRTWALPMGVTSKLALSMADANTTLTSQQARCAILEFTGTLTAQRTITLPLAAQQWTVFNNTTGGFGLQFNTGPIIAATKRAIIYSDGSAVQRVTPDT